jgi:hypothetical protein
MSSNSPAPVVSVVMPAYNAARTIGRAIDSVLGQTFNDLEVIVVDDGSQDGTLALASARGGRVRAFGQANAGPAAARNTGLGHARGEFVAFLDADDHWLPHKLERQVQLMRMRPEIGWCSTATRVVDEQGRLVAEWGCCSDAEAASLTETLFVRSAAVSGSTSGVLARTALVRQAGGFDASLRGFEDPDLWIRLSAQAPYGCIAEPLTMVVRTPGSVSSHLPRMRLATLRSFEKNRGLLPPARRGAWWRAACAGALADYAKMAWRRGAKRQALAWTVQAMCLSPWRKGRLGASLLLAMIRGRAI